MANVYVEARPKGRPERTAIDGYVVEDHIDSVPAASRPKLRRLSGPRSGDIVLWWLASGTKMTRTSRTTGGRVSWRPDPPNPIHPRMLPWRTPPGRSRRPPPAGFIRPARPLLTMTPRAGPEWIDEVKHDGYRLIARKEAGRVVLWSRYATDYSDTFLRIAEAVRSLPADHVMIDGEAVVFRPDGHSDFTALRTTRGAAEATLVAFDLLQFQGEDWGRIPLEVRRDQLDWIVPELMRLVQR